MIFHLDLWFERYHRLKKYMSAEKLCVHPLSFNKHFLIHWDTTDKICYMDGNVSFISQLGLQQNPISSSPLEAMNRFAARYQFHQRS